MTDLIIKTFLGIIVVILGIDKLRRQFRNDIAKEVWIERKLYYKQLFAHMEAFSLWPKNDDANFQVLYNVSVKLKEWYFGGGGLFLSESSMTKFKEFQELVQKEFTDENKSIDLNKALNNQEYEVFRESLSALRSELVMDVASRNRLPSA